MSEVIRLLPDHIANQIAAGEVIQRPASVVKELVENAIDAGASEINVLIKDAGKTLIQVLDNGTGMSEIDARMAFERHATSKVSSADDLFALRTKGFRGEALASIAAIAHVSLKTRQPSSEWGTELTIEGSKVSDQIPCTCKVGSSFEVKNLFFNVPARRNFLKSDAVEFKHIEDDFLRIALAHPAVQLTLQHNDTVIYHLPEANLRKRIVDAFGRSYNDKLVPVDEETGIVRITGFVGKPEFAKKSRGEQFLFVNDRFFRDTYFNHAITQAFDNLLASKTFPSYFLFFYVDPSSIDVNVHPTKTEIKFEDDREIYAILKSSVKQGLGKFNIAPALDFEQETSFDLPWDMRKREAVEPVIQVDPTYNPFKTSSNTSSSGKSGGQSAAISNAGFGQFEAQQADWKNFYSIEEEVQNKTQAIPFETENTHKQLSEETEIQLDQQPKTFIQHGNYLVCSLKNSLLLLHYKRAKERILYDEMMQLFMLHPIDSQQLMFPLEFELRENEKLAWEESRKTIERTGFSWEMNKNTLHITGCPAYLKETEIQDTVQSISEKLIGEHFEKGEIPHEIISSIARSVSLTPQNWNSESANVLLEQLFQCTEHQYSPRGKVILSSIPSTDIHSKFNA